MNSNILPFICIISIIMIIICLCCYIFIVGHPIIFFICVIGFVFFAWFSVGVSCMKNIK